MDERGAGTLDYVGAVLVVAVIMGAVVAFVPSVAPDLACTLQKAVVTAIGGSPPGCASSEASTSGDGTDGSGSDGDGSGDTTQAPWSLSPISPDGTVPSGTTTQTAQLDAPDCDNWTAVSDKTWAIPHNPRSQHPQVDGPANTTRHDFGARGSGSGSMDVTFHANPGEAREATITVYCSDGRTISQKVVQPGGEKEIAATGDSFAAGSGGLYGGSKKGGGADPSNPKQHTETWNSDDCWRTDTSPTRILANGKQTSAGTPQLRLDNDSFVACQGATTNGNHLVLDKSDKNNPKIVEVNRFGYVVDEKGNLVEEDGRYVKIDDKGKRKLVHKSQAEIDRGGSSEELDSQWSVQHQIGTKKENGNSILGDADIVTISVGGNDIGFATVVADCTSPTKSPTDCQDAIKDANTLIEAEDGLKPRLRDTYEKALKESPGSTIYVIGYPPAVEADDWTGRKDDRDPGMLPGQIHQSNIVDASKMVGNLNRKIAETVDEVNASNPDGPRLVFVDPAAPDSQFVGHSANKKDPYVNRYTGRWNAFWENPLSFGIMNPQTYHPNAAGNDAIADITARRMLGVSG